MTKRANFKAGNHVVYPAHGVGKVLAVEEQAISGYELEMLVIEFEKEKMLLRIPTAKVQTAGLRTLSTKKEMQNALKTLKGKVRIKRTMWSRRAQEYEAKINSGDPNLIAEVVAGPASQRGPAGPVLQRAPDLPGRARTTEPGTCSGGEDRRGQSRQESGNGLAGRLTR